VDFKRIINNEEQALINLIHVQEGLVGGTKAHKYWDKKTQIRQFDLSLLF
jgi:hypothetical protein